MIHEKNRVRKSHAAVPLKGLSHEIEMGQKWYWWIDINEDKCLQGFLQFSAPPWNCNSILKCFRGIAKGCLICMFLWQLSA
ncbi:MAG: hypothetical protein AN484_28705, partial [Aphanizomenon flos-aquae WA102]